MGTTLTGTTPQDTYDSLIKVTDNGPLSGTAKYLSDGLGNDSVLALSTAAVGIGTNAPTAKLELLAGGGVSSLAEVITSSAFKIDYAGNAGQKMNFGFILSGGGANQYIQSMVGSSAGTLNLQPFGGNVGIGTSSPTTKFVVSNAGAAGLEFEPTGLIQSYNRGTGIYQTITLDASNVLFRPAGVEIARFTANGLTFNGDTAAANALDDYEEGTWTMGISFGGASVGVTYTLNTGTYTKIGRQVTVNGYLTLSNKGSSTGTARITGLPFTIANSNSNYAGVAFAELAFITRTGNISGYGIIGATTIYLLETSTLGALSALTDANFANNSTIMVSLTYFV